MALEDIMGRVTDLAQAGAAKAKEVAEITRLKVNSAAEQDTIRKAYIEIGKLYYAEHAVAPEMPYAELCAKVTASLEKIEYNKQKIADIKAAGNIQDEEIPDVEPEVVDFVETEPQQENPDEDAPSW